MKIDDKVRALFGRRRIGVITNIMKDNLDGKGIPLIRVRFTSSKYVETISQSYLEIVSEIEYKNELKETRGIVKNTAICLLFLLPVLTGCATMHAAGDAIDNSQFAVWNAFTAKGLMKQYPGTAPYLQPCLDEHPKIGNIVCPHIVKLSPGEMAQAMSVPQEDTPKVAVDTQPMVPQIFISDSGSEEQLVVKGDHISMIMIQPSRLDQSVGRQAGDTVFYGNFIRSKFFGTWIGRVSEADTTGTFHCFGTKFEVPVVNLAMEGDTMMVLYSAAIFDPATCEKNGATKLGTHTFTPKAPADELVKTEGN